MNFDHKPKTRSVQNEREYIGIFKPAEFHNPWAARYMARAYIAVVRNDLFGNRLTPANRNRLRRNFTFRRRLSWHALLQTFVAIR